MIKAVLQAITTHQMSCLKLWKKTFDDSNKIATNLWWGDQAKPLEMHWCSWQRRRDSKFNGGIGFRDLHGFNVALLAKLG